MFKLIINQLLLIELLTNSNVKRRKDQSEALDQLLQIKYIIPTSRNDTYAINDDKRGEIEEMLNRASDGKWKTLAHELKKNNLQPTPADYEILQNIHREEHASRFLAHRTKVNKRTYKALTTSHSKTNRAPTSNTHKPTITDDDVIRIRPNNGLAFTADGITIDAAHAVKMHGELIFTHERLSNSDQFTFSGTLPHAILTVENLGAYIDLVLPDNWLATLVPGNNTKIVQSFFDLLPDTAVAHFGDFDLNGFKIFQRLKHHRPNIRHVLPDFWAEFVDLYASKVPKSTTSQKKKFKEWTSGSLANNAPTWCRELMERGLWLEQEIIVLDPRLPEYLESLITYDSRR